MAVKAQCPDTSRVDFENHWASNEAPRIPESKRAVAVQFLAPLFRFTEGRGPMSLLDAGCGDGVHAAVIDQDGRLPAGSNRVGLDISLRALALARGRARSPWQFVQGDLANLPFPDGSFDAVFSFGVLAYTASPARSFGELCRVTRPGGLIGVWVYPRPRGVGGLLLRCVRRLCRALGPWLTRRVADLIVPLLGLLPARSGLTLRNATWAECREVVLVNIAPARLAFPERAEVRGWFARHGVAVLDEDERAPVTLWGEKLP